MTYVCTPASPILRPRRLVDGRYVTVANFISIEKMGSNVVQLLEQASPPTRDKQVDRLLAAASGEEQQRRGSCRFPYFAPVTLSVPGDGTRVRQSCFSRDVSEGGMGLVHHFPVIPGEVLIEVHLNDAELATIAGTLVWCAPAGDGWYLSGVRFAD